MEEWCFNASGAHRIVPSGWKDIGKVGERDIHQTVRCGCGKTGLDGHGESEGIFSRGKFWVRKRIFEKRERGRSSPRSATASIAPGY